MRTAAVRGERNGERLPVAETGGEGEEGEREEGRDRGEEKRNTGHSWCPWMLCRGCLRAGHGVSGCQRMCFRFVGLPFSRLSLTSLCVLSGKRHLLPAPPPKVGGSPDALHILLGGSSSILSWGGLSPIQIHHFIQTIEPGCIECL